MEQARRVDRLTLTMVLIYVVATRFCTVYQGQMPRVPPSRKSINAVARRREVAQVDLRHERDATASA